MKTKNMKHLLTLLMSLVSLTTSAYDIEVDGIYYTVTSLTDLTCTVTYGDKMYEGTVIIPATIEYNNRTLTVTNIQSRAFRRGNTIHSLTIPNTISFIPDDALYDCTSLDSLIIQDGDTEIDLGRSSRYILDFRYYYYQGPLYNTPTSYVYIGRNLKKERYVTYDSSKGYYAYYDQFYNSQLKVAEIGDKVTAMPFFYQSEKLEKVIGGKGIVEIGDSVFYKCSSLASVSFPNVQTIGEDAFYRCSSLASVSFPNVQTIGKSAFSNSSLTQIDLPQSLESIGKYAFWGTEITDIIIPNKVKKIEPIFPDCIKSITLGDSIESIASYTFQCDSLETINIYTVTPPVLDEGACGNAQYINVNVNVPIGSKEAYQQADVWKNFWSINEIDPTGIESIADDDSTELAFVATTGGIALSGAGGKNVNVYRMTGEEVLSVKSYQGQSLSLPKGIYVIKAGKKALKVQL